MGCNFSLFIYFEYCGKYYVVYGGYIWLFLRGGVFDFFGKNGC